MQMGRAVFPLSSLLGCPVCALAQAPALHTDPCHSLRSLDPPQAALTSLPVKIGNANTKASYFGRRFFFA